MKRVWIRSPETQLCCSELDVHWLFVWLLVWPLGWSPDAGRTGWLVYGLNVSIRFEKSSSVGRVDRSSFCRLLPFDVVKISHRLFDLTLPTVYFLFISFRPPAWTYRSVSRHSKRESGKKSFLPFLRLPFFSWLSSSSASDTDSDSIFTVGFTHLSSTLLVVTHELSHYLPCTTSWTHRPMCSTYWHIVVLKQVLFYSTCLHWLTG